MAKLWRHWELLNRNPAFRLARRQVLDVGMKLQQPEDKFHRKPN